MNKLKGYFIENWIACCLLLVGLLLFTFPIVGYDFKFLPGDLGDGRFNIYILEHGYKFLSGEVQSYWSAPFMYPEENVITISDNLLGVVPFYSFFRMFGAERELAFQLYFILTVVLSFIFAYGFFKFLIKNKYAAVLGAFVFAFSLSHGPDMEHAQMWSRFVVPLVFWASLLFLQTGLVKHFLTATLLLVYTFYCGIYLGMLVLLPIAFILIWALIVHFRTLFSSWKLNNGFVGILLSSILSLTLLYILMEPYIERSSTSVPRVYGDVLNSIPVLKSYFYTGKGTLFYHFLSDIGNQLPFFWNHQISPGLVAIISLVISIAVFITFLLKNLKSRFKSIRKRELKWIVFGLAVFLTFLFFIRIQDLSLYSILFKIPGFSAMRSLTRIINVEILFFAAAVCFVAYFSFTKWRKQSKLIFLLFTLLVIADNYQSPEGLTRSEKSVHLERRNDLIEKMDHLKEGTLVSYEPENPDIDRGFLYQLDAMTASQELNLKCVNGYSATAPYVFDKFWSLPNEENRLEWFKEKGCNYEVVVIK